MLATLIAGLPTGAWISDYRKGHILHHRNFGTDLDPDWVRYQELDLEDLNQPGIARFVRGVARRLWCYQIGWIRSHDGRPAEMLIPITWPFIVILAPLYLVAGGKIALVSTGLWVMSFILVLPVIRLIGEASEHRYRSGKTVFDATVTNVGWLPKLLIHPHNDGYHTAHHMWPGIPYHNLAKVHHRLLIEDPLHYAGRLVVRNHLLELPRPPVERGVEMKGKQRSADN